MVPQDAASPRPSARELPTLETRRLLLRPWRAEDRAVFAEINGDPRVMEHYPSVLSPSQSAAIAERIEAHFLEHGFGLWAVELSTAREFIGFIGLQTIRFQAAFTPGVEIGWRLAADRWGSGYATEGARAAAAFGFDVVGLEEILAFTVPSNQASRRVMEKLGMRHDADGDFDHPSLPAGGPLRRHVLYRLRSPAFGQTLAHRRLTRWTPHPMDASPDGRLTR